MRIFIFLLLSSLISFGATNVTTLTNTPSIGSSLPQLSPLFIPNVKSPATYTYAVGGLSPVITNITVGINQYQGSNITFYTTILSTNQIGYQWYKGSGTLIPGATKSSYTITNIQSSDKGIYYVNVTNIYGQSVVSSTLTVLSTNILPECFDKGITVNLAWDYNFTNEPTVVGFNLYSGAITRNYTNVVRINQKVLTGTITNLPFKTTNYISATVKDGSGLESIFSNELLYITPTNAITRKVSLEIMWLTTGVPKIQMKVCPFQVIILQYTTNFVSWANMKTLTADKYGNVLWDDMDPARGPFRFYRAQIQ